MTTSTPVPNPTSKLLHQRLHPISEHLDQTPPSTPLHRGNCDRGEDGIGPNGHHIVTVESDMFYDYSDKTSSVARKVLSVSSDGEMLETEKMRCSVQNKQWDEKSLSNYPYVFINATKNHSFHSNSYHRSKDSPILLSKNRNRYCHSSSTNDTCSTRSSPERNPEVSDEESEVTSDSEIESDRNSAVSWRNSGSGGSGGSEEANSSLSTSVGEINEESLR